LGLKIKKRNEKVEWVPLPLASEASQSFPVPQGNFFISALTGHTIAYRTIKASSVITLPCCLL
jgi:hypothetical protein